MRVGFAGLGRMGARMAENCARAGHELSVWNRSAGPAEELASRIGADIAPTPAELAAGCELVISMLANDEAAHSVYLGENGLIAASGADLLVEMGTMSPGLVAELAAAAGARGKRFVDAPVSGATAAAADAQLLIMAGADDSLAARLGPVFDAMGRQTIWLGRSGAGAAMKLAVNMLIHGLNQTVAEALTLAESAGIEPARAFDVFESSAAAAPMLHYRRALYLDEAAQDVTFTVDLAAKDLTLALDLATATGVAMPQTRINLDILRSAMSGGFGARDMASVVNYMRGRKE